MTMAAVVLATGLFQAAPCDLKDLPADAPPPAGVECGWVSVPRDHAAPDGPTLRLWTARLKATGPAGPVAFSRAVHNRSVGPSGAAWSRGTLTQPHSTPAGGGASAGRSFRSQGAAWNRPVASTTAAIVIGPLPWCVCRSVAKAHAAPPTNGPCA